MQRLFPRVLLACIAEARPARPCEVEIVTEKVWREAFEHRGRRHDRHHAMMIAVVALIGDALVA